MNKNVNIIASPHPLRSDIFQAVAPAGKSVREILPDLSGQATVMLNGEPLTQFDKKLKEGDRLFISMRAAGSTETRKDVGRVVGMIAVMAAAGFATGGLGLVAAKGILAYGMSTAITVGGSALVSALTDTPRSGTPKGGNDQKFNELGSLTGASNQMNPWGVVPRIYGHRKVFPPFAAQPYTQITANEQYMRCLFCIGYGPLELSNPKIGDTVIGSFDSDNDFISNGNYQDLQVYVGATPPGFGNQVNEDHPGVPLNWDSDPSVRTTDSEVMECSLDIVFPAGLFIISGEGRTNAASAQFNIQYRETGTSVWLDLPSTAWGSKMNRDEFAGEVWTTRSTKRETHRIGVRFSFPTQGQYDVRIERRGGEPGADGAFSALWQTFRSMQWGSSINFDSNLVFLSMRVKATDQINGVLQDFSVEAKSRLPYYDGSDWDTPAFDASTGNGSGGIVTSNPAWIAADIMMGEANGRAVPESRLDGGAFKAFADHCDGDDYQANIVVDGQTTVSSLVKDVMTLGRASLGVGDNGIYKPIEDRQQATPIQHFTPRNSWGFSARKTFADLPHALRVQFINPDRDWQTDEAIVYDDGYDSDNATKFEKIEFNGVTSWDMAWKFGRFKLAEARLRPEIYSINVDVENLVATRGDMVKVSHDVPLWGSRWGRVKSVHTDFGDITGFILDEPVIMETGGSYVLRIRTQSGDSETFGVVSEEGQHSEIGVSPKSATINPDDLFMFGEELSESVSLKIARIEPQDNLSARLTLVDAAPEIYDADTGTIPEFDSQISAPIDLNRLRPPTPSITGVRSNDGAMYQDVDGSKHLRIIVDFEIAGGFPSALVEGRYRREEDEGDWSQFGAVEASTGSIALKDVEPGGEYRIQIRSRSGELTSRWVDSDPHTLGGKDTLPSDVTGFNAQVDKVHVRLEWNQAPDLDLKEYEVRKGGTDWDDSVFVERIDGTSLLDRISQSGDVTYRIKAIDTFRNKSESASSATVSIDPKYTSDPNFEDLGDLATLDLSSPFTGIGGTLNLKFNETSLKLDANGAINTIQPIAETSTPAFQQVTVNNQASQAPHVLRGSTAISAGTGVTLSETLLRNSPQISTLPATLSQAGHVTTESQSFAGVKTFSDNILFSGNSYLSSINFTQGFDGSGGRFGYFDGSWKAEVDDMYVRGAAFFNELIINQISAVNGSDIVSPGRGKIEQVQPGSDIIASESSIIASESDIIPSAVYTVSDPQGNDIASFAQDDIVIVQQVQPDAFDGGQLVKRIVRQVGNVTGNTFGLGGLLAGDAPSDTGEIEVGDIIVAIGNSTNEDRQATIYRSVIDSGAPSVRVNEGVASWTDWISASKAVIQYGNIAGLPFVDGNEKGFWARDNFYVSFDGGQMKFGRNADGQGNPGIYFDEDNYWLLNRGLNIQMSSVSGLTGELEGISSSITANSEEINLRVETANVINSINISEEEVVIEGNKLRITSATEFTSSVQIRGHLDGVTGSFAEVEVSAAMIVGSGGILQGLNWHIDEEAWVHPTLGGYLYGEANKAGYGINDKTGTSEQWWSSVDASADNGGFGEDEDEFEKLNLDYIHKEGINMLRMSGRARRENYIQPGSEASDHFADIVFSVGSLEDHVPITSTSLSSFSIDVDVSSLTPGNVYELSAIIRLYAAVYSDGSDAYASTDGYLEDSLVIESFT